MPLREATARYPLPLGGLIIIIVEHVLVHEVAIESVVVCCFGLLRNSGSRQ